MKTKIILLIGAVALVTLSFTFAGGSRPMNTEINKTTSITGDQPVGGLYADVVE